MKKKSIKLLAIAMSAVITYSCMPYIYAKESEISVPEAAQQETTEISVEPAEYSYTINGAGDVTDAYHRALGSATDFYSYNCIKNGVPQAIYTVYTDPSFGGYMKGIELGKGVGQKGRVSKLAVDADSDEKLLAAVNADFFSLSTGVPLGVFVKEGKFISSSDGHYAIGFDEKGNAFLGKTDDKITLLSGEKELEIEYLNKFATIYGVYLITEDFGPTVRNTVAANEYIISMSDKLEFGGKTECEVLEVRRGDTNGTIPEGCGVLIVPDEYMYSFNYVFEVGDKFEISVSASEEFSDAVNVIGGGDIILSEGVISDNINDEALETSRNPRTAMGITGSGELVFTVVDGRQSGYSSGVTMTALAEIMLSLGCVSAINLDGGGSSVMALFDSGKGSIVNSPSDKSERAVPNALAIYESRSETANSYYMSTSQPDERLLTGSVIPLEISIKNSTGETVEYELTEENTKITLDGAVGNVEFSEGRFKFTAGKINGVGKLHVETEIDGQTVSGDIFVNVTDTVDRITADQTIILSDSASEKKVNIQAYKGKKTVYYGDLLSADSEEPSFMFGFEDKNVYISVNPQGTADEMSAFGTVNIRLSDKTISIPAYFSDSLTLVIDDYLADSLSVSREGYTVEYDKTGGVIGEGAFIVKSPPLPEPEPEPELPDDEVNSDEQEEDILLPVAEEDINESSDASADTEIPADGSNDDTVTESSGENEPEPLPVTEPFNVEISSGKLVSDGLGGRKLWMWVDGLAKGSEPYAVLEVYNSSGKTEKQKIAYDMYYDFTGYNGQALLVLDAGDVGSIVKLKTLLGYTAFEEEQRVSIGPITVSAEYDTNLYYDTAEHWSSYYVNSLSYMGIVGGSEDLKGRLVYIPDDGLSREQFAKILVNYLGIDVEKHADVKLDFADVNDIAPWAIPFVKAAVGEGLMKGRTTPEDTVVFAPSDGIKRQEAIYVLGGLLPDGEGSELTFTDKDEIAPWAEENFSRALAAGLISGYDDGSVRPEGGITRGEAATLVVRLYSFSSKS